MIKDNFYIDADGLVERQVTNFGKQSLLRFLLWVDLRNVDRNILYGNKKQKEI